MSANVKRTTTTNSLLGNCVFNVLFGEMADGGGEALGAEHLHVGAELERVDEILDSLAIQRKWAWYSGCDNAPSSSSSSSCM